jgi:PAP2 superfamily protein
MSSTEAARRNDRLRVVWWRELALLVSLYLVYMGARALVGVHPDAALSRGQALLDVEAVAGLDVERSLNSGLNAVPPLAVLADYIYATLHYILTPAVLLWLAVRHRADYRRGRNTLLAATAVGLVGYWLLPTAPPRLLQGGGFLDTMALFSDWGWWGQAASAPRGMEGLSNQYAALPSLHVGWALWCAWVVFLCSRSRWLRTLATTYAVGTVIVVIGTGNHYLLDAVGGAAVLAFGVLVTRRPWTGSAPRGDRGVGCGDHDAAAVDVALASAVDGRQPLDSGPGRA